MSDPAVAVVIPTVGRPSLAVLLEAIDDVPLPVVVVDDRRNPTSKLALGPRRPPRTRVVRGRAEGPAAARNVGWRAAAASNPTVEWIAFLDDDVEPEPGWFQRLGRDLGNAGPDIGGSQGRITVPLPRHRRPTDWERDVAGLATARWATADMTYRRAALAAVGGFDERFPRAFREDADLAARVRAAGWRLTVGQRRTIHPVRPADRWVSLCRQAGNADDVLMRAVHGRRWRAVTETGPGRRPKHLAVTGAALTAIAAAVTGRRRAAAAAGLTWLAGTAEFAWARIAPGPRTPSEIATMTVTSAAIPPAATAHWLRGWLTLPATLRKSAAPDRPAAVLLDRDGTLIHDVPYNGDPAKVAPVDGARSAIDRLRAAGVPTAVVSNQSGIARGLIDVGQVDAVNRRVEELLGPLGPWLHCPHGPEDGCDCRKPKPGLILQAADLLGVPADRVAVIGDIGADVEAAAAAGARSILVPTPATRSEEVAAAPEVAASLSDAVDRLIGRP